jgi:cholesterol oxidase
MENPETTLSFTEEMKGYVTFGESDYDRGYRAGRAAGTFLMFHLTITVRDVPRFLAEPKHQGTAGGFVQCDALGGQRPVGMGTFNLFVNSPGPADKRMLYRLYFEDGKGAPLTLTGFKEIRQGTGFDVWGDTTTLFTRILRGHVDAEAESSAEIVAAGILHIYHADFLKQLTTFRVQAPTAAQRLELLGRFCWFFLGSLWEVYGHLVQADNLSQLASHLDDHAAGRRVIPLYALAGVKDADVSTHYFWTEDKLGLSMLRFRRRACDDVVLIIHGLTTSSDMFIMPEHVNLVQYLLDHGFSDVWTLDFRMSNRHSYNLAAHRYNMDDIALYDFPAAVAALRQCIGDRRIHVICHCLGSVSFLMSLFGKAVSGITSVISNSVGLTPRVPGWSRVKLAVAPFLVEYVLGFPYLNPRGSEDPGLTRGKMFSKVISLFHWECNVPACHMLSLMWGTGWPALYSHANLHDVTHRRGGDLYGGVGVHYYRHVRKMVRSDNCAVKYQPKDPKYQALPNNYFEHAREIETPILFMTGDNNRVFTDSNILCHSRLEKLVPGRHRLHVFPGYGHQDVFMGKTCDVDVFPTLLQYLNEHRRPSRATS